MAVCLQGAAEAGPEGGRGGGGPPSWVLPLLPVASLGLWCLGGWTVAIMGGWARLADRHRAGSRPSGHVFRFQSMSLGRFTGYGNMLTMIVAKEGLYLAPIFLWRVGHPPLLIPWGEFAAAQAKQGAFGSWAEVEVGRLSPIRMKLPDKVWRAGARFRTESG